MVAHWDFTVRAWGRRLALVGIMLMVWGVTPSFAQDNDGGALNIIMSRDDADSLLYPMLFATDGQGRVIAATDATGGLVRTWAIEYGDFASTDGSLSGQMMIHLTLRDDLTWRDGAPITAYDVFFSLLHFQTAQPSLQGQLFAWVQQLRLFAPQDEHRLTFLFGSRNCSGLEALNQTIRPAHILNPEFSSRTAPVFEGTGNWLDEVREWEQLADFPSFQGYAQRRDLAQAVAPGDLRFVEGRADEVQRFEVDGLNINAWLPGGSNAVDAFIKGDIDVIVNPPPERREELRALPDVQIYEPAGARGYALLFNFANPNQPQSAFDAETGAPIEQGVHPVFGDIRVREAMRLLIDRDALSSAALLGNATPLTQLQFPWSWAYDDSLTTLSPDLIEAGRLLDEAGWRDWNRDGIRECRGCQTAATGTQLTFNMVYSRGGNPNTQIMVRMLGEQLASVGFGSINSYLLDDFSTSSMLLGQQFDVYLMDWTGQFPLNADWSPLFAQSQDRVGEGANIISYANAEVDAAFERAASAAQCDYDARAAAWQEANRQLLEDVAYIPLFVVNEFYATQGAVIGFAPELFAPFRNWAAWDIRRD